LFDLQLFAASLKPATNSGGFFLVTPFELCFELQLSLYRIKSGSAQALGNPTKNDDTALGRSCIVYLTKPTIQLAASSIETLDFCLAAAMGAQQLISSDSNGVKFINPGYLQLAQAERRAVS